MSIMVEQRVRDYIERELGKGYTPKLIVEVLVERGFSKEEVEEEIREAQRKQEQKGTLNPEQRQEQKIRKLEPGDSVHRFLKHFLTARIHEPNSRVVSFVIAPVCMLLLAGSVLSVNKQIPQTAHLFRSLFVLITASFVLTPVFQQIGARLNFHNRNYAASIKFLFAAGAVFLFLEFFLSPGVVMLLLIPAMAAAALILRTNFVADWFGAVLATVIILVLGSVAVYALIAITAVTVAIL